MDGVEFENKIKTRALIAVDGQAKVSSLIHEKFQKQKYNHEIKIKTRANDFFFVLIPGDHEFQLKSITKSSLS